MVTHIALYPVPSLGHSLCMLISEMRYCPTAWPIAPCQLATLYCEPAIRCSAGSLAVAGHAGPWLHTEVIRPSTVTFLKKKKKKKNAAAVTFHPVEHIPLFHSTIPVQ